MTFDRAAEKPRDGAVLMPTDQADPLLSHMHETTNAGSGRRSRLSVWLAKREAEITELIRTYGARLGGLGRALGRQ